MMGKSYYPAQPPPSPTPQGYELVHHNTHCIYELVEHVKGKTYNQNCRISTTQDNNRISKTGSIINNVAEARGLEPDQWHIVMNNYK